VAVSMVYSVHDSVLILVVFFGLWRFNTLQRDKSLWMGIQRSCPNLRSLIPMKFGFFLKPSLEEKTAQFNLVLDGFF